MQKQNYPNTQENEQMFQITFPKKGTQLSSSVKKKQGQVTKKNIETLPGHEGVLSYSTTSLPQSAPGQVIQTGLCP